ncbi:MAG: phosphoglycerate kinase [Acidobacteria bacterium]|nr:MAG: phosphoglycerate kinase [Acidobacteriota bacterium]REK01403.1 MAG: phosphoglycerate kinase [Acidobacteriota bacterium]REK14359.1 MAG: phosphoglycerate kinase [Acidobacteriota bacterium]REK45074.1 MAG: phosphoglycerate kinase [Acidobacteriota bacterium]
MKKKSVRDLELKGKRVFVRVDFNVPLKDGEVTDDTRITGALPTIRYIIEAGGRPVLASHLGRPTGEPDPAFSLSPVAAYLGELLGQHVAFASDCIGEEAEKAARSLEDGQVLVLENVRFHEGEKKNDPDFAEALAKLADVYVNDAFGTAHRAHASTEGITEFVEECAAGLLMEKELEVLGKVVSAPERPFVAILGGAKVSDKLPVIKSLIDKEVNRLLIGGAMAYTFLKAMGYTTGKSLVEDDMLDTALDMKSAAEEAGVELLLPTDHQVVDSFDPLNSRRIIPIDFTNAGLVGLDIGTETAEVYKRALEGAKTIVWNGPMGMFEEKPFDEGTLAIADAVAEATDAGAFSVVGGGDSVAAVNEAGLADRISHISTGGGATLEFLSGVELPGVSALDDALGKSNRA